MPYPSFKVGDKVSVPQWIAVGGRFNRGIVTHVDGGNILVKLNYQGVICHLLINEVIPGWR